MINVHSYESMGTFDGPGLRLVVFLQGCPFRCLYCANPDTIDVKGGTPTSAGEILQMAVSQKAFFGKKGGITFSGGEPTLQAEALIPLFKDLKANGIHICLDTNGGIWNDKVEELLSLTDLVLLDIKEFNPERHRTLTGRSNEQTLRTAAWLEQQGHPFWLRYVLVPGYSDFEEDIRNMGEQLGKYQSIQRVEILPYHRLGVHKYEAMGWDYQLKEVWLCKKDGRKPYVGVKSEGFYSYGIWSPKNAPFVCLEPWAGRCDDTGFDKDISEKKGINAVQPGEIFEKGYQILVG